MGYNMKDSNIHGKNQLLEPHENEYMRGHRMALLLGYRNGKYGKRTLYLTFHYHYSYRHYILYRYHHI